MTRYIVTVMTDDLERATTIADYARGLGAEVSVEADQAPAIAARIEVVPAPPTVVLDRPLPTAQRPHQVYGIFRDGTLGYVGMSVNADERIQQHMKKATEAMEPFVQWLVEGKKAGDIVVEVVECADRAEAKKSV
jgi:hypothetical protein